MATQPLSSLLGSTADFSKKHWKEFLLGALVLGTILAIFQINLRQAAAVQMGSMMNGIGDNSERMQAVMERMQAGDQDAVREFAELMGEAGESGANMMNDLEEARLKDLMFSLAPVMAGSTLVSIVFMLVGSIYFFLVVLKPEDTIGVRLGRIPGLLLPMLGLWFWTFLRSFLWIPIIGIIPALYYYPRFIAAPIFLIEQQKGVLDSTRMSMESTQYYWGKIVGNNIVFSICVFLIMLVLGFVYLIFGAVVSEWLSAVTQQFFVGVGTCFMVLLAKTILQNPLRPARP